MSDLKFTTAGDYMSEFTNEELVEAIKRPDRYYRIVLTGYGGESTYCTVSKETHDFWKPLLEENGDGDLVNYMICAEDEDFEFDYIDSVPESAQFMKYEDGTTSPWYEPPNEFEHTYGVTYDSARIEIDEVDSEDYSAGHVASVIEHQNLSELANEIYENSGEEYLEIQEYGCCDPAPGEYVAQLYSIEKGCFFDGILHLTNGEKFDPRKLRVQIVEYLNGEDTVVGLTYDGEDIENSGGDTNGKGYSADVWKV